ncbi:MAG: hypothetical protein RR704_13440 [Stenotrophomonas sp.]
MKAGGWARPLHRWTSIVFTLAVVANFIARGVGQGEPVAWLTYSPLPPLFLQLFTGLDLFALHFHRARSPVIQGGAAG